MTDASKPLRIIKQERYAQELYKGTIASQAYVNAGYKANKGNASELANSENIIKRVAYLQQVAALRKGITVDSLCDELTDVQTLAVTDKQLGVAVSAVMGKAKLMGLLIDKKESGKAGEFSGLSVDELRKQLKADLDALEAMRALPTDGTSH